MGLEFPLNQLVCSYHCCLAVGGAWSACSLLSGIDRMYRIMVSWEFHRVWLDGCRRFSPSNRSEAWIECLTWDTSLPSLAETLLSWAADLNPSWITRWREWDNGQSRCHTQWGGDPECHQYPKPVDLSNHQWSHPRWCCLPTRQREGSDHVAGVVCCTWGNLLTVPKAVKHFFMLLEYVISSMFSREAGTGQQHGFQWPLSNEVGSYDNITTHQSVCWTIGQW